MTPHGVHACMALHASFRLIVRESRQRSDDTMVHQKFTTGALRKRAYSRTLATTRAIPGANGIVVNSDVVAPLGTGEPPHLSEALEPPIVRVHVRELGTKPS